MKQVEISDDEVFAIHLYKDNPHCMSDEEMAAIEQAFTSKDPRLDKFIALYKRYIGTDDVLDSIFNDDAENYRSYCGEHENCETGGYRCGNDNSDDCKNCCTFDGVKQCFDGYLDRWKDEYGREQEHYRDGSKEPCMYCGGSCHDCRREGLFSASLQIILELLDGKHHGYGGTTEQIYLTLMDEIRR